MTTDRRQLLKGGGLALLGAGALSGQELLGQARARAAKPAAAPAAAGDCHCGAAADGTPLDTGTSEIRPVIERYQVELQEVNRRFLAGSALHQEKSEAFYAGQLRLLESIDFDVLSQAGKVDYLLLRTRLTHEQKQLAQTGALDAQVAAILPFQQMVFGLEEARRNMETIDAQKTAATLAGLVTAIAAAKSANLEAKATPTALGRAAVRVEDLRGVLQGWNTFYDMYDPTFSWWAEGELQRADAALETHAQFLYQASGGTGTLQPTFGAGGRGGGGRGGAGGRGGTGGRGGEPGAASGRPGAPLGSEAEISGAGPAGNEALIEALREAWIPYTPDELIALANKEFAWCDAEMLRATGEMGFGADWKKALEKVKNSDVAPGQMIYFARDSAKEAIAFMEAHDVLTIPEAVKNDYWEQALTPAQQLVSPFFLGGGTFEISSPASSMSYDEKLDSMRANNIYEGRAVAFHEMVPGHHMQGYMTARYRAYRSALDSTPFWTEGMAFYWEMLMWDLGYTHTPEQRVGALFWRKQRCARIVFSLNFHLGKMTALECVSFLIDRVGHDRASAEGEVRRSFNGSYAPIYQCAYMLGALQFYAMHKELVISGKMTNRQFHDAFYIEGNMPIELVRAAVAKTPLTRDYQTSWKFYGNLS